MNKINPHALFMRDGLSLMNGTSCMTALSTINIINAKKLLAWGVKVSSMMLEIFRSYDDYTSDKYFLTDISSDNISLSYKSHRNEGDHLKNILKL